MYPMPKWRALRDRIGFSPFLSIRAKCYDLLHNYLQGDSRKNELYLAKHVEFFMVQITEPVSEGVAPSDEDDL